MLPLANTVQPADSGMSCCISSTTLVPASLASQLHVASQPRLISKAAPGAMAVLQVPDMMQLTRYRLMPHTALDIPSVVVESKTLRVGFSDPMPACSDCSHA
jgi:hypothetical protein